MQPQVFVFLGAGVNQFFGLRYPGVHIVSLVAELIAYPLGVFLAHVLPISRWNPDRHFNIKEHALVTIMSNVSFGFGSADATNIIQAAKLYGFALQTGFSVLVVLCCQLLGYGVAGLSARWLVEPVRQPTQLELRAIFAFAQSVTATFCGTPQSHCFCL